MEKLKHIVGEILWNNDFSDAIEEVANEIQSIAIAFANDILMSAAGATIGNPEKTFQDFINNHYNSNQ